MNEQLSFNQLTEQKKLYVPPQLLEYGDLISITQNGNTSAVPDIDVSGFVA